MNCKQIANLNLWNHEQSNRVYSKEYISPTLRTKKDYAGGVKIMENNMNEKLRIRKLTNRECFRLMGVKDEDSKKIKVSDSQQYKQAGNSIVTTCLMAIYCGLLGFDNVEERIMNAVEEIKQTP